MKNMTLAITGGLTKSSISLMLVFSMLMIPLFPNPTYSKYVLDTIDYDVTFAAVKTNPITAIGAITGEMRIGSLLTAGALTPYEASAAYQWQSSDSLAGPYTDIPGATSSSYTLTENEYQKYIRLVAAGVNPFSGTVISGARGPVAECMISAMSPIVGSAIQGYVLTAGTVFPLGSTVTYQWQKSQDGISFTDISGATGASYLLQGADSQHFIQVVATGTGYYTGTAEAVTASKVSNSAGTITAIGPVSGITEVGRELAAGDLTPYGATATYQWQRSDTGAEGSFTDIPGAAYRSYITTADDYNKYIRVVASGSASFVGTVTSNVVGPISYGQISGIGDINGTTVLGNTLVAGALTPAGATVSYQWKRAALPNGVYEDITGAVGSSYVLTAADLGYYIKVFATGTGSYYGTVESAATGPVSNISASITGIGGIYGSVLVGSVLTAGEITPTGANVTYQWQVSSSSHEGFANIAGANSKDYTITAADYEKYIRVVVTGAGNFSGQVISDTVGPVGPCQLISMSPILGSVVPGHVLTAGTILPADATVDYQWQMATDWEGTSYVNVGSNSNRFLVTTSENARYIKLIVTGKGCYSGTLTAITLSRVGESAGEITAIGDIGGTAQVSSTLTAGALTPANAVVTYQWQSSDTGEIDSFTNILGATESSYTLTSADCYKYIRLKVKGSGRYTGELVSNVKGPVLPLMITGIDRTIGTTAVGEILTAGSLSPAGATAVYQWQRSASFGGEYVDIPGATGLFYTLMEQDLGYYFKVKATGTGSYLGTVTSAYIGPVSASVIPITAIGSISGEVKVGSNLAAGALSPAAATVTYQWQKSDSPDGVYINIAGATSAFYTLTVNDYGKYIRVIVNGSGKYSGSIASSSVGPVAPCQLISMSPLVGANVPGQVLSAGTIMPSGATVDYQWQRSDDWYGTSYSNIGSNSSTLVLTTADKGRYIRLVVTGKGAYTGSLMATTVSQVQDGSQTITGIGNISGTLKVGSTLTAGAVTPNNANVTYQWQSSNTNNNSDFGNIYGATSNTYTLGPNDYGKYIRVVATGAGTYLGSAISSSAGPVGLQQITGIGAIAGTTTVGETLTAGTLYPLGATAHYQWQRAAAPNGFYENIPGATDKYYTLIAEDEGYYFKVTATGNGSYTGNVTSAYTGPVGDSTAAITAIGSITGIAQVNGSLTAGNLEPAGAAATYQWQSCDTVDGIYIDIQGATSASYTPTASDYQKYLRVVATGSGNYTGVAISEPTAQIASCPLISISPIVGATVFQQQLSAGTIMPYGATVQYQWQLTDWYGNNPTDIAGANSSTFMLTTAQSGGFIRLVVTGTGAYSGTLSVMTETRVGSSQGTISGIGDIEGTVQVGSTLSAGAVTPAAAAVTYQWQSSDTEDASGFSDIYGATFSSYTLTSDDCGKYIRLVATGSGNTTGSAVSGVVGPVIGETPVESVEITAFDAIEAVDFAALGLAAYSDAAAVIASLPTIVTANSGELSIAVIDWEDTDIYDPELPGSYTFTAVLGEIPAGYANTAGLTAVVEVIVSEMPLGFAAGEEMLTLTQEPDPGTETGETEVQDEELETPDDSTVQDEQESGDPIVQVEQEQDDQEEEEPEASTSGAGTEGDDAAVDQEDLAGSEGDESEVTTPEASAEGDDAAVDQVDDLAGSEEDSLSEENLSNESQPQGTEEHESYITEDEIPEDTQEDIQ